MKKKPPPGATLIARLKEKRLQREQEPKASEESGQVLDVESQEIEAASTEGVQLVSSDQPAENTELALRTDQGSAANLLHSNISIDDLRPSTDDYDALTEEIRLAGRFAAIGLIAQGLRLARIQQAEIHKEHYSSFEEYCRAEHQMSATYAYRLIRMGRMAEKFSERTSAIESGEQDPYERMLNLGHRHLMALLPLGEETVEEFLVHGVPLSEGDSPDSRVPLDKATERQIKQALKKDGEQTEVSTPSIAKRASKMLGKELPKLVSMLEQCAEWVETSPPELELAKMEKAEELKQLADRFKQASDKIFEALRSEA